MFKTSLYSRAVQPGLSPYPGIKNVIAVGAGKGGVGKSTISYFLAQTLVHMGLQVGLVDADVYGPSLAVLTGIHERAIANSEKKFLPHFKDGLYCLSIAHLVDQGAGLLWRGPMASGAVLQLIEQTSWPVLDFLIIDMPPGTGDILLSLTQKIPIAGAVLISQPHPLSYSDYLRAKKLFEKTHVNILGTILNQKREQSFHAVEDLQDLLGIIGDSEIIAHLTAQSQHPFSQNLEQIAGIGELQLLFEGLAKNLLQSLGKKSLFAKIPIQMK